MYVRLMCHVCIVSVYWEESFHFFGVGSGFIWVCLSVFISDLFGVYGFMMGSWVSWGFSVIFIFMSLFFLFTFSVFCLFHLFELVFLAFKVRGRWRFCGF